ncbi:hypothetical protein L3X38_029222 [Prunus dulcis]|uniref:Secreted protein n=1 Tax=Prunus dulcis TaxID=3755 RepID=A0AAD4VR93_PRUDU|nr:hypothetical protein L3X38_029222 [Prunus dulcis]
MKLLVRAIHLSLQLIDLYFGSISRPAVWPVAASGATPSNYVMGSVQFSLLLHVRCFSTSIAVVDAFSIGVASDGTSQPNACIYVKTLMCVPSHRREGKLNKSPATLPQTGKVQPTDASVF